VDDDLLADQQTFYRRRAPDYDEWWQRRGRYDEGPTEAAAWQAEVDEVAAALSSFGAVGDVLELAGGTGWWTERLASTAGRLTVVDGSTETLALNRARVGRPDVVYVQADLFTWEPPPGGSDVVFFSFWLSHVPRARVPAFWAMVRRCLRPGGRVFFVDNRHDPTRVPPDPFVRWHSDDADVQVRRLADGSEHRVVKVFYEPDELAQVLGELGWRADVRATSRNFVYGTAVPTPSGGGGRSRG
jgi:demethylmenaquinone methyltransferase/2-methoxy-6-polyprenyl-1,4-benzoquinol methylase